MWQWMRDRWGLGKSAKRRGRGGRGRSRASGTGPSWDPQATLRGLRRLATAGLVLGIVAGTVWAERELMRYARHRPLPAAAPQTVMLVDAPAWMSPLTRADIRAMVADAIAGDPLSSQGLEDAAAALRNNPWVARVRRLERDAGSGARVLADYRCPTALIEGNGEFYLAAADGVRLPGVYMAHQVAAVDLPLVVDVRDRVPREGEPWGDDVLAALRLVRVLEPQPYFEQVRAISVRDEAGRTRPALLTDHPGAAVFWGRPVGEEQPIEVSTQVKLQNLETVYRQRGSIDAGGKRVHIYGPAIFVERPGFDAADETTRGVSYTW